MAPGAGIGGLFYALLPLIGIMTILRARARRKRGKAAPEDKAFEARLAATQETERRMAAYLAQRSAGGYDAGMDDDERRTSL